MLVCHRIPRYQCPYFVRKKIVQKGFLLRSQSTTQGPKGHKHSYDTDLTSKVLTLLHKTGVLLPKIASEKSPSYIGWEDALDKSYDDVNSRELGTRKRSIIVLGPKRKREAIVNALLDDGFTLSDSERTALRDRWKATDPSCEAIVLSGESIPSTSSTKIHQLNIRSPLLSRYNVQLTEYRNSTIDPLSTLLNADLILEIHNPNHKHLPLCSSKKIVITDDAITFRPTEVEVIQANPSRALEGIDELTQNSSSPSAISIYQHDTHASRIASVHEAIRRRFTQPNFQSQDENSEVKSLNDFEITKYNSARNTMLGASEMMIGHLGLERDEVGQAKLVAQDLRRSINGLPSEWEERILGPGASKVTKSLSESEGAMRKVLGRFAWWKLPFKVDDLGNDIGAALYVNWCCSLDREIIYEAGILSATQISLRSLTHSKLASLPNSFQSSLLTNSLQQLTTPTHTIKSSSLTQPLHSRLNQLLKYPTTFLHSSAQKVVLKSSLTTLVSAAGGYGLWFGEMVVPETALGVGLLGSVVGMRWAVASWERAKKGFWRDWRRVGEGLEEDLKVTLRESIERNVISVPELAATWLEGKIETRTGGLVELEAEASKLNEEIKQL